MHRKRQLITVSQYFITSIPTFAGCEASIISESVYTFVIKQGRDVHPARSPPPDRLEFAARGKLHYYTSYVIRKTPTEKQVRFSAGVLSWSG